MRASDSGWSKSKGTCAWIPKALDQMGRIRCIWQPVEGRSAKTDQPHSFCCVYTESTPYCESGTPQAPEATSDLSCKSEVACWSVQNAGRVHEVAGRGEGRSSGALWYFAENTFILLYRFVHKYRYLLVIFIYSHIINTHTHIYIVCRYTWISLYHMFFMFFLFFNYMYSYIYIYVCLHVHIHV